MPLVACSCHLGLRVPITCWFIPASVRSLGLVHPTHTTATKLLDDAVMRDGLADHATNPPTG
jgi:hypothetical protein